MIDKGMALNSAGFWISERYEVLHEYGTKTKDGNPNSTSDGS
jgi:hypothetical protein